MKLDLKVLSMRFSQLKDEPPVPTDGVNQYLLEEILLPCMINSTVYLQDIDYGAFDMEDIDQLERYYDDLSKVSGSLRQLTNTVRMIPPEAHKSRMFC